MTNDWWSRTDPDQMVAEAMSAVEHQRRKLTELTKVWDEQTELWAKNRSFTMLFDGRGELLDLKFRGEVYRKLAPAELASTILETMRRGRAEAAERAAEVTGPNSMAERLKGGKFDPLAIVDELIGPMVEGLDHFGVENPFERPALERGAEGKDEHKPGSPERRG